MDATRTQRVKKREVGRRAGLVVVAVAAIIVVAISGFAGLALANPQCLGLDACKQHPNTTTTQVLEALSLCVWPAAMAVVGVVAVRRGSYRYAGVGAVLLCVAAFASNFFIWR
jgi:hypothetical protein